jgi:hypothetical protein
VIATLRLEPPDECEAYPRCGLDATGHCRCHPRPTLRIPPPDPVLALDALSIAADEAMARYLAARRGADTEARTAHDLREAARMRARKT